MIPTLQVNGGGPYRADLTHSKNHTNGGHYCFWSAEVLHLQVFFLCLAAFMEPRFCLSSVEGHYCS